LPSLGIEFNELTENTHTACMAEQFIQTPMALYHFSLLSWARIFWGMAGIVCWRWAGAKKKTRGFGKTNL